MALQNFWDLDYHFVSPVHFTDQDILVLAVTCDAENDTPCDIGAYVTGTLTSPPTNE